MADRLRFGIFEFTPATGELSREGTPVKLQSQPVRVLGLLLAAAGEIVTRDRLRDALWGSDTFVDFDRGLNYCVAQIRSALGDSAESPRFIRTIPKQGYQFIAPVEKWGSQSWRPPALIRRLSAAVVSLLLVALAAAWLLHRSQAAPRIRIAVARFENQTSTPELNSFTDGLTDAVVAELTTANPGRYAVIGNAAILRTPREHRDMRSIAATLNVPYVILGQVQRNTSQIRVLAHLIRMPEQTHIWVARIDFPLDDPLVRQSELARRIVAEFSPRLAAAPPASHASASN